MDQRIIDYFKDRYEKLFILASENKIFLFSNPSDSIMKGRIFSECLAKEIFMQENIECLSRYTQVERINKLSYDGVIDKRIADAFHAIRKEGNKVAHDDVGESLELALIIDKNLHTISGWFIENYIDFKFTTPQYRNPLPTSGENMEGESKIMANLIDKVKDLLSINSKDSQDKNEEKTKDEVENVIDEKSEELKSSKQCLIEELSKLKESAKEAVEGLKEFSSFKKYMHVSRKAQDKLEELIFKSNEIDGSQLILVCGSVGDGKSHIISYFKNEYPDIISNFTLHNDATESLEPDKTSMDTLNEVLNDFSDEMLDQSNKKFILAINLGTLNNFIDSEYGSRFSKLKKYVEDKKILETTIEEDAFDSESPFHYINFSDYHLYTIKDGKISSDYIKTLLNKVTDPSEINIFYKSYKENCSRCMNCNCCPIKANYELLGKENVKESIVQLLVQCIIKEKILISTRALLNFIYEIIISRSYIDVNSPTFKNKINKLNNKEYIKSLTPNIIFNHKELSIIFEALNTLDPLNNRNEKLDDFIMEFNNSKDILGYFKKYVDYPSKYLNIVENKVINNTTDKNMKKEMLMLFIRSYALCGKGDIFHLNDEVYDSYIKGIYYWNKGDKSGLKKIYSEVKDGIEKWNGDAEKNHINIFLGKNQVKYKISEELQLKVDVSNLPHNDESELFKFITNMKLKYKNDNTQKGYEIEVDFSLYELLIKVSNGYRPNKKDKNHFIKFIEFINKLEEAGSQDKKLIFTEKNRENNKTYKLEYDDEFEEYRFVEM